MASRPVPAAKATALATALALTAAAGVVVVASQPAGAAGGPHVVAKDRFNRPVSKGWGRAEVGGAYRLSGRTTAAVHSGSGRAKNIRPGSMFAATLPSVSLADVRSQVTFSLSAVPRTGNGVYAQVALRQQPNGNRYLAVAHVRSGGTVGVALSRVLGGKQVYLTGEKVIGTLRSAGTSLTVRTEVEGAGPARLRASAYLGSATKTSWDVTASDNSAALRGAGTVGMSAYVSASSKAVSVAVLSQESWDLRSFASVPPPAAPPTTQAPTPTPTTEEPTPTPTTEEPTPTTPPTTTAPSTPDPTPTTSEPTPPATPAAPGSAPLGSTDYPVPADALWVSPTGSDSSSGTQAAPLRTLARAKAVAPTGATIVLKAGSYHETVDFASNKRVTIQSAPHSVVWLDGSRSVTGWTQSGSTWSVPWTAFFDRTPSYTGTVYTQAGWGFVNPAYPYAAYPDQMWFDGQALTQVGAADQVTAGTFFADQDGKQLVIGRDPAGADVRASDLDVALSLRAAGSVVRGIGIKRYATPVKGMGTLRILGAGSTVENVISQENATTGMTLLATGLTVRNITTTDNGMLGIHGNNADDLSLTNVLSERNNLQRFNSSPVAGGIKISRSRGLAISDVVVRNNLGTGLWLDESCYDMRIVHNTITDNSNHGLFVEISAKAVIADNTITGNGSDGIKINDTNAVRVWNNTLGSNNINIEIVQDTREYSNTSTPGHDNRQAFPDPTMTWKVKDIEVVNTVLGRSRSYNLNVRDYTNARTAAQMNVRIVGSHFTRNTNDPLVVWGVANGVTILRSVADIASAGAGNPNSETVGTTLAAPSSANPNAQALPADIAALVGQPAGTRRLGTF